ncbi:sensor histidine kinase [Labrys neptuniae]|uniref:histidine kinase n=1 Tax=Labrys neptuniae TaxID=376174 RepID=A0ABV3PWC9_9HYPH
MRRPAWSIATFAALLLGVLLSALLFCLLLGFLAFWGDDGDIAQFDIASEISNSVSKDNEGRPQVTPTKRLSTYQREFPQLWYLVSTQKGYVSYGKVPARVLAGRDIWEAPQARSTYLTQEDDLRLEHSTKTNDQQQVLIELGGANYTSAQVVLSLLREPDFSPALLLGALAIIIVTTILVVPVIMVKPVKQAAAAAEQIGAKPGARLPVESQPTELRPLASAFNRALDRIDAAIGEQRRFLSNAAHELRTPLARLRTRLEQVEEPALKTELINELQALSGTVTMLLQLARLTSQSAQMNRIDLVGLAREVAAREVPAALTAGVEIEFCSNEGSIFISGSAQAIGIGLSNLIRNAVQHGGAGGRVVVEAASPGRLSVIDFGEGVSSAHDGRSIFEPFARGKQDGTGTGLGLSIVAQIAALHAARLSLDETPGGGTTVSLIFPN